MSSSSFGLWLDVGPGAAAVLVNRGLCRSALDLLGLRSSSESERLMGPATIVRGALAAKGGFGAARVVPVSDDQAGTGGREMLGDMATRFVGG